MKPRTNSRRAIRTPLRSDPLSAGRSDTARPGSARKIRVTFGELIALRLGLFIFGTSIGLVTASAQTTSPGRPADYGPAVERLVKLGMPDSATATYVKLTPGGELAQYGHGNDLWAPLSEFYELKLEGNAWLIHEDAEAGTFQVILRFGERETFALKPGDHGLPVASWAKADAKKDANTLAVYLKDDESARDRLGYSSSTSLGGRLLLAAAQFHRVGFKEPANQIAGTTLNSSENPELPITQALSLLAQDEYTQAAEAFFETKDWEAFTVQTAAIVAKYGRGWDHAHQAEALIEALQSRPETPPVPEAPGDQELSQEDLQLALELAQVSDPASLGVISSLTTPWVLDEPDESIEAWEAQTGLTASPTIRKIVERGIESVPLLIALLRDEWFLPIDQKSLAQTAGGDGYGLYAQQMMRSSYGGGEDAGAISPRPLSRSDIAVALLTPLLPPTDSADSSTEKVYSAAMLWYSRNKGRPALDIARAYMLESEPHSATYEAAFGQLLEAGNPEDLEIIETRLLEGELNPWSNDLERAETYLRTRGKDGAGFLTRLKAKIERDTAAQMASIREYQANETHLKALEDQVKATMDRLQSYVSVASSEEILGAVLSGEKSTESMRAVLESRMAEEGVETVIGNILTAATEAKTAKLRFELINLLSVSGASAQQGGLTIEQLEMLAAGEAAESSEKAATKLPSPVAHTALWQELLADDSVPEGRAEETDPDLEVVEEKEQTFGVNLRAAWIIEQLYRPEKRPELELAFQRFGGRISPLLIERAQGRVEGKPEDALRSYPAAISEERLGELESEFIAFGDDLSKARARLDSLTLDELSTILDLAQEQARNSDDPSLVNGAEGGSLSRPIIGEEATSQEPAPEPHVLVKLALAAQQEISTVNASDDWKDAAVAFQGSEFSEDTLQALVDEGLKRAGNGDSFTMTLVRKAGFGGFTADVKTVPRETLLETPGVQNIYDSMKRFLAGKSMVMVSVGPLSNSWYQSYWLTENAHPPAPIPSESTEEEDPNLGAMPPNFDLEEALERSRTQFMSSLGDWMSLQLGIREGMELHVVGTPGEPAAKPESTPAPSPGTDPS